MRYRKFMKLMKSQETAESLSQEEQGQQEEQGELTGMNQRERSKGRVATQEKAISPRAVAGLGVGSSEPASQHQAETSEQGRRQEPPKGQRKTYAEAAEVRVITRLGAKRQGSDI